MAYRILIFLLLPLQVNAAWNYYVAPSQCAPSTTSYGNWDEYDLTRYVSNISLCDGAAANDGTFENIGTNYNYDMAGNAPMRSCGTSSIETSTINSNSLRFEYITREDNGIDQRVLWACGPHENWSDMDTDQDGTNNGEDLTPYGGTDPADFCEAQPNQINTAVGKQWNTAILPDKYCTLTAGTYCSYDRISTGIDSNLLTATFQPATGTCGAEDKPTSWQPYVLERCDGEILSDSINAIEWDSLPSQLCVSNQYGDCLYVNPDTVGSDIGSLTVTYQGTDSSTCYPPIVPDFTDYAETCAERENIIITETGDYWNSSLPTQIGDGTCRFALADNYCTSSNCTAIYNPDNSYTEETLPDFSQYIETYADIDYGDNPSYSPQTHTTTDLTIESSSYYNFNDDLLVGRTDACVSVTNTYSDQTDSYTPDTTVIQTLPELTSSLQQHINSQDVNIFEHKEGTIHWKNSAKPDGVQADTGHFCGKYINALGFKNYIQKVNSNGTHSLITSLSSGTSDYLLTLAPHPREDVFSYDTQSNFTCSNTTDVSDKAPQIIVNIRGYGFSDNGDCSNTQTGDNGTGDTTDNTGILEKLSDIYDAITGEYTLNSETNQYTDENGQSSSEYFTEIEPLIDQEQYISDATDYLEDEIILPTEIETTSDSLLSLILDVTTFSQSTNDCPMLGHEISVMGISLTPSQGFSQACDYMLGIRSIFDFMMGVGFLVFMSRQLFIAMRG